MPSFCFCVSIPPLLLKAPYTDCGHECLTGHYSTHGTLHTWHSRHHSGSTPQTSWCMHVCRPMYPKCDGIFVSSPCRLWPRICTQEEPHVCIATRPPTRDQSHRLTPICTLSLPLSLLYNLFIVIDKERKKKIDTTGGHAPTNPRLARRANCLTWPCRGPPGTVVGKAKLSSDDSFRRYLNRQHSGYKSGTLPLSYVPSLHQNNLFSRDLMPFSHWITLTWPRIWSISIYGRVQCWGMLSLGNASGAGIVCGVQTRMAWKCRHLGMTSKVTVNSLSLVN